MQNRTTEDTENTERSLLYVLSVSSVVKRLLIFKVRLT